MKVLCPSLVLLVVLSIGSKARAEGAPAQAAPATAAAVSVALPAPGERGPSEMPVRPLLSHYARQEGVQRYGEGALGIAGGAVLVGAGFVANSHDSGWSYPLWITGGVVAVGSVARLLMPSELESLEARAGTLSEQVLRSRWADLARQRRLERRVGAVLGGLLGATSIVLGSLVVERELGDFDDDPRRALGTALIGSGALGIVEGVVNWFVPSPIEVGYGATTSQTRIAFAAGLAPSGVSVAVGGAF